MPRRGFTAGMAALAGATLAGGAFLPGGAAWAEDKTPFSRSSVIALARQLAAEPFKWPEPPVPKELAQIGYSQYQGIRYKAENRLWAGADSPFTVDLLHSGFIYNVSVEVFTVADGMAEKLVYRPDLFTFAEGVPMPAPDAALDFAGFRARTHLNGTDYWDEFAVFAGASYFRAVARGQVYGLSARGLAINTAEAEGEEFPFFRAFWVERPDTDRLIVHALLDSASTTGAYRFTIAPGDMTVMDVEAQLFARRDIKGVGLAPLTSMFLFDEKTATGFNDFRPSVHDSDGLLIWNGRDEWLWRPLRNPSALQVSAFVDLGLKGFGLMQRERRFNEFEDLEALYHRRPSLWVEPIGDWQKGAVVLVEIPTDAEVHDNIVAFWRPDQGLAAGAEITFTYRLYWGWDVPKRPDGPVVTRTLTGQGSQANWRRFVLDYAYLGDGPALKAEEVEVAASASKGAFNNVVLRTNHETGGLRVSLELDPAGEPLIECRVDLKRDGKLFGESWVYRWTA
ncbi:MAG: glucan biosynthesis protein [Geminicoccaceae bacterium]|nr:glucan biosynthesis protein [Geminicoccaceae bacterium]